MRKASIFGLVVALLMIAPPAEAVEKSSAPMRWSMGAGTEAGLLVEHGQMRTRATVRGVRMSVVTDGLVPGHAYTHWVMFFNHPEHCVSGTVDGFRCGAPDYFANPAADASAVYGSGIASATGTDDHFRAFVGVSPMPDSPEELLAYAHWRTSNSASPVAGLTEEQIAGGTGLLTDPLGAEYHAVLFDHGPYDPERYGEDQWTMHDGGCHVGEDNVCMPLQAAGAMGMARGATELTRP